MLHPMEYANVVNGDYPDNASLNQTQYTELLTLIDMVKRSGLSIVTLNNVSNAASAPLVIPSTSGTATSSSGTAIPSTTGTATPVSSTTGSSPVTPSTTGTGSSGTATPSTTGTASSTTGTATVNLNNCSCVVFRLDDIQDYWLNNVQTTVMKTFRDRHLPLTIGIIANYFGSDTTIVNYVNQGLADSTWKLEVADHGWNHEDFTTKTYSQQLSLLSQATNRLKSKIPGVKLNSFIPPFNAYNTNTINALKALNYSYMSSQLDMDPSPYPLSGITMVQVRCFI